jgi:hypothetical protein
MWEYDTKRNNKALELEIVEVQEKKTFFNEELK